MRMHTLELGSSSVSWVARRCLGRAQNLLSDVELVRARGSEMMSMPLLGLDEIGFWSNQKQRPRITGHRKGKGEILCFNYFCQTGNAIVNYYERPEYLE